MMRKTIRTRSLALPARALTLATLALTAAVLLAGCSTASDEAEPAASVTRHGVTLSKAQRKHIDLIKVTPSSFRRTIDTTGVVDYDHSRSTQVLAPFSGPVTQVLVAVGDEVKVGQALARVASPDFASVIAAYRKALVAAHTARTIAKRDQDLLAHQGISQREAAQAQAEAAAAGADRDAARQALKALQVDPGVLKAIAHGKSVAHSEGVIRAPIAGIVVAMSITPGQRLEAGSTPAFTIADLSRMWVRAQLFGAEVAKVHAGDPAEVVIDGHEPLTGKVTHVAAKVDPATGSVTARVVVDNPHDVLKKHMFVRVRVHPAGLDHGLLLPVSAVLRDENNRPFVYLAQADGSFARRHVTLGYRGGDRQAIASGLAAGQRVVSEGGLFLRFMQSQ